MRVGQHVRPFFSLQPGLARIFHELPAATADMSVLPGVLRYRTLRRTVQVRLAIRSLAVARWHSHLHGLATPINEISGLKQDVLLTVLLVRSFLCHVCLMIIWSDNVYYVNL